MRGRALVGAGESEPRVMGNFANVETPERTREKTKRGGGGGGRDGGTKPNERA